PILSAVKKILQHGEIAANCIFDYQEVYISVEANTRCQEKVFSEFYNCEWWSHAQQHIPFENKVLAIILYSDATTLDYLEKSSRHPIYISLENIPTTLHNRAETKALVGIISILKGTKEKEQTPQFRQSLAELYEHDKESITEIFEGLCHLAPAINDYFKLVLSMREINIEKSEATLILYESFILSNEEQVRALKNYYNTSMFSDVAILMDSEQKFEVLLLICIIFKNASIFNLALVHCEKDSYDFEDGQNKDALVFN
ncbi:6740_t:CDS:2, partial [Dentiscutata heterogama]